MVAGRDHDWASLRAAAIRDKKCADCVPVRGHRPALYSLHLGHHRHPQGRGARQRRAHGRAQVVDGESLRRQAGRSLLGGVRHRLGGRPQLHRLRAAVSRLHLDRLRGQARRARRTPGAFWRVISEHGVVGAVHRAHRVSRDQEGGPAGQIRRRPRPVEIPHAVSGRRARRSGHGAMGRAHPERAGDRSLVADRDRLVHRRQPGGPRPAAGEIRLGHGADAGLRRSTSSTTA